MRDKAYLAWSLLVLTLSYMVPYLVLRECRDLSLYAFWLALTLVHFAVTLIYLRGDVSWRSWPQR